jgi:hypothetical protein
MKTETRINLTEDEAVKWACLFECLYNIYKHCQKTDLDYDYVVNKKLKPNHINNYIDNRFPIMCNLLETEGYVGEFMTKFLYGDKE